MTAAGAGLVFAVALASFAGTAVALTYARRHLLDVPSERSSHQVATPRGGGIAIAAASLCGIAFAALLDWVPVRAGAALAGGGALVAAVGWLDDHRGMGAGVRLLVHAVAAAWAVWWLGPLAGTGAAGAALAVVGIVWAVNLYNFMDGIDGLAAAEAVTVAAAAGALLAARAQPGLALAAGLAGAGALGFLPWNAPRARIFMGDVGSGLLGYLFGVLTLAAHNAGSLIVPAWLTLLGVFVFDATVTLARRIAAGERLASAHRQHAYQRMVHAGWAHWRVTLAAVLANAGLAALVWWDLRTGGSGVRALVAGVAGLGACYLAVERAAPLRRFAPR
jgi:Fuc2NAc and GlcNAc transferase